jgi:hypothetical protein
MIRYDESIDVNAGRNQPSTITIATTRTNSTFFPSKTKPILPLLFSGPTISSFSSESHHHYCNPHQHQHNDHESNECCIKRTIIHKPPIPSSSHQSRSDCFIEDSIQSPSPSSLTIIGNSYKLFNRRYNQSALYKSTDSSGQEQEYIKKRRYNTKKNSSTTSTARNYLSQFARVRVPSYTSSRTRIPPLLAKAFTPEIHTSYSYKCSVRSHDNFLRLQSVNLVLDNTSTNRDKKIQEDPEEESYWKTQREINNKSSTPFRLFSPGGSITTLITQGNKVTWLEMITSNFPRFCMLTFFYY